MSVTEGKLPMFSDFAQRHESGLQRFVQSLVRSREDAEDIAQEAMLRAYRTRDRAGVIAIDSALERKFRQSSGRPMRFLSKAGK